MVKNILNPPLSLLEFLNISIACQILVWAKMQYARRILLWRHNVQLKE